MTQRNSTGRIRKAWRTQILGVGYGGREIIYAPTAEKARYQKFLNVDCDSITFASIRVTRSPEDDIMIPVVDGATSALDKEQKSTLMHTMKNGRFYTSKDDKTLCSLVQAGFMRDTGRGWNDGETYFVLTDAGHAATRSLEPLYPEYPEYGV